MLAGTNSLRYNEYAYEEDATASELPYKPLTRDEAQALRARLPMVSPWRVVAVQAVAGVACAVLLGLITQQLVIAWSALYGAAAIVLPNVLMARGATRRTINPMAAAVGLLVWEMLKIGVAIAMLVIASKVVPHLSWPALLATMVVCIKVNWFALLWRGKINKNR